MWYLDYDYKPESQSILRKRKCAAQYNPGDFEFALEKR